MTPTTRRIAALPCPRCGNAKTLGTFCAECLRTLHPLVTSIKPRRITLCSVCPATKLHNDWKEMDEEGAVIQALEPSLSFGDDVIVSGVEFGKAEIERKPGIKKKTTVLAVVTGRHEDASKEYEEEYECPLLYEVTVCPRCSKRGTGYFEGILQVRNQTPSVRGTVLKYLAEHRPKGLRLAKEVPNNTGSDYYLSDHRAVGHLAKLLHATYGGELKISAQHFSFDSKASKNLYRVNALLVIPDFFRGDVVKRDDDYVYIVGVGKKVKAENLMTGSRLMFLYEPGVGKVLSVRNTTVSKSEPLEVIHPMSFQSVCPTNSKYAPTDLDTNDKVSVAVDGDYLFLIPRAVEKDAPKQVKKRHGQKRRTKDDDHIVRE